MVFLSETGGGLWQWRCRRSDWPRGHRLGVFSLCFAKQNFWRMNLKEWIYVIYIYIYTWIFQVCKICVEDPGIYSSSFFLLFLRKFQFWPLPFCKASCSQAVDDYEANKHLLKRNVWRNGVPGFSPPEKLIWPMENHHFLNKRYIFKWLEYSILMFFFDGHSLGTI